MKIMKKGKKTKGFTLIELIIVIAIIGILALIIIPQVIGYTNKARNGTDVADAKTLISAIDTYNAEQQSQSTPALINLVGNANAINTLDNHADSTINDAAGKINAADSNLAIEPLSLLQNIINGANTVH